MSWLRANLFATPFNAALTIGGLVLLYFILVPAIDWAVIQARWSGAGRADCGEHGACWVFVKARLGQFIYGFYPAAERWRVDLAFVLLFVLGIALRRGERG